MISLHVPKLSILRPELMFVDHSFGRWWYFPCYAILLISATPFMILPTVYVACKHLFNVNTLDYYVAVKGGSTTAV